MAQLVNNCGHGSTRPLHKPRGPRCAVAAVVSSLRLKHKAAIAHASTAVSAIAKVGRQAPALLPSWRPSPSATRKAIYTFAKAGQGFALAQPLLFK